MKYLGIGFLLRIHLNYKFVFEKIKLQFIYSAEKLYININIKIEQNKKKDLVMLSVVKVGSENVCFMYFIYLKRF